jgi:hypothetical protein
MVKITTQKFESGTKYMVIWTGEPFSVLWLKGRIKCKIADKMARVMGIENLWLASFKTPEAVDVPEKFIYLLRMLEKVPKHSIRWNWFKKAKTIEEFEEVLSLYFFLRERK